MQHGAIFKTATGLADLTPQDTLRTGGDIADTEPAVTDPAKKPHMSTIKSTGR